MTRYSVENKDTLIILFVVVAVALTILGELARLVSGLRVFYPYDPLILSAVFTLTRVKIKDK